MLLRLLIPIMMAALAGTAGCGAAPEDADDSGASPASARHAIVDGEPSPSGAEDGVILLRILGLPVRSECSASLIAPNLALTARHCVAPLISGRFTCSTSGELIDRDAGAGGFEPEYAPERVAFFGVDAGKEPVALGRTIVSTRPVHICMNDIALVVLDRDVDLPVLPIRRAPARRGDVLTAVGFGAASDDEMLETLQYRRRKTGIVVDRVGPNSISEGAGTVPPRMFATVGPFACRGDSGGPAISEDDGGIVGVYSTQRGERCEAVDVENYFVHVPAYASLFERAFAEAGAVPVFSDGPEEPAPPEEVPPPAPSEEPATAAIGARGGCALALGSSLPGPGAGLLLALAWASRRLSAARRAGRARAQGSPAR